MSEEILINSTPVQTRVALVESGVLQEIYVERSSHTVSYTHLTLPTSDLV